MKKEEETLLHEVQNLTQQLEMGIDVSEEVNSHKRELEALEKHKANKIIYRSKCN